MSSTGASTTGTPPHNTTAGRGKKRPRHPPTPAPSRKASEEKADAPPPGYKARSPPDPASHPKARKKAHKETSQARRENKAAKLAAKVARRREAKKVAKMAAKVAKAAAKTIERPAGAQGQRGSTSKGKKKRQKLFVTKLQVEEERTKGEESGDAAVLLGAIDVNRLSCCLGVETTQRPYYKVGGGRRLEWGGRGKVGGGGEAVGVGRGDKLTAEETGPPLAATLVASSSPNPSSTSTPTPNTIPNPNPNPGLVSNPNSPTPTQPGLLNRFEHPDTEVESCTIADDDVYFLDSGKELTATELASVACAPARAGPSAPFGPSISFIGHDTTYEAMDGQHLTVAEFLRAVGEHETAVRGSSDWCGGVDTHHVFFEGVYADFEGRYGILWGS